MDDPRLSWSSSSRIRRAIIDPTRTLGSPNINGGDVVVASGGSGKSGIYMTQPRYQFIANGAWQAPLGIDLGANLLIRQGYPTPWYTWVPGDILASKKSVLVVPSFSQDRLPIVHQLDLRVGKTHRPPGPPRDLLGARPGFESALPLFSRCSETASVGPGTSPGPPLSASAHPLS